MSLPVSPLAPKMMPAMPVVQGVRMAAGEAGIKYKGRTDALLMVFDEGTHAACVTTRSKAPSAPVDWCREVAHHGKARALVVNAGNANAFTGRKGVEATTATAEAAAALVGCKPQDVFLASTGVIGEPLPYAKLVAALPGLDAALQHDAWVMAAQAIMTTDTFPKYATRKVGGAVINGIAKGSGMIAPDMATMLAFIATDAEIAPHLLQGMLERATVKSFNCTTVDGDTSTSDTALLFATGKVKLSAKELELFERELDALCVELAQQIVRDGEGARKFIAIHVRGAEDDDAARKVGLAIANSPLVKTAIAGEDANWGRIVMAVGKSGEKADRDTLEVAIGGVVIAKDGERVEGYDEAPVAQHVRGSEIEISVDLHVGEGVATVWTCDLTHGYIDINAHYRS